MQPAVSPLSFPDACAQVVATLKTSAPMASWSVCQQVEDRQVYLYVSDDAYGADAGGSHAWSESICQQMIAGAGPRVAPDVSAVPAYATTVIARRKPIGAYVGIPIRAADGRLFGTLCGLDPLPQQASLAAQAPQFALMAALLEQVLQRDVLLAQARQREAERLLRARHDELTGLPNRGTFHRRLAEALDARRTVARSLSVLKVDLDDFTAVNDTVGHADADQLLVDVAGRVAALVPDRALLARLGGDRFAVLLEDGADPGTVAARVLAGLARPFTVAGLEVTVRASIGIGELPHGRGAVPADTLLTQAEVALRAAKHQGKGRAVHHDPAMALPGAGDLLLREPLRRAIADGTLRLHYQPVVDLDGGPVTRFEGLARWTHDGVPIGPDVFVPVAARSGLLPALTQAVLEQACAQAARWTRERGTPITIGVNVCPVDLVDPAFPDRVDAALTRHGLPAGQLVLEVTEDALLADVAAATAASRRLRDLGVELSLDDFGTGYSSLLHLRSISLGSLKIDRGFVRDVDTDPGAERFLRALLGLGRELGLDVVVEGVERQAQADLLRRLGCRRAQGFLFSPPRDPSEVCWDGARATVGS
ncbi:EAL domain-containing protein [Modestobacter sp. I12A-02628]|uniref:EAL domain-containing protein n=1 Tax=Goekera deserti TaxID=2497753 RepID=A0A7K3WAV5_9ACTN|nr:EAL domain-containing protein [Goekera deserti]MPQ98660.1 EAL domain-containing protein [Goekera deserti]NDI49222.1 EAL domain-containing protein [Goekera deserti]NEL52960.1 EAL domain-containing protein [Goekera deserti]